MPTVYLPIPALRIPTLDRQHWPTTLVLVTMLGLYTFAGLSVIGGAPDGRARATVSRDLPRGARGEVPPRPEPLAFREIPPQDAVAINAAIPLSLAANPAAGKFRFAAATDIDRLRSIECLTAAVYYEAATEPLDGQRAVAQVVLNRLRHPAYPKSVCGVVFEGSQRTTGCQFTFTCDGSLRRTPAAALWKRAREVAEAALGGKVFAPVGWATHYHTNWVVPYWSSSLVKAANVGTHIFYRWTGGWGRAPAFSGRYAGVEPDIRRLQDSGSASASLATAEVGTTDALAQAEAAAAAQAGSIDSFQRAVLRRYEPATRQGVATTLAAQTRRGETVPATYRWALTGEMADSKQAPLGKKADAIGNKPAAPEGVKKQGDPVTGPPKPAS